MAGEADHEGLAAAARVTFVSHDFGYGGDLMYWGEIFAALRPRLGSLSIVVPADRTYANPDCLALVPGAQFIHLPLRRSVAGAAYPATLALPLPGLLRALGRTRPDVVVAVEFTPAALLAAAYAAINGAALALLVEGDPASRGGGAGGWARQIKRRVLRRADAVQTSNEAGANYLRALGAVPERLTVAPYLTSKPPGRADLDGQAGAPLRILFANSLDHRKGADALIAGLAHLTAYERAQIALTVVGGGPARSALEEQAVRGGLADQVRFVGPVVYRELGAYLAAADVLAIPSRADYRSLAGFEGLAYGLALLASTRDGASAETLVSGQNGFLIDPAEPAGIARAVAALVADRAMLARMRAASLERYEAHFSLEGITDNLAVTIAAARQRRLSLGSLGGRAG